MLSNATVPILGAVDTGVVGQLGEAAPIGAVGIGAIVLTAVYWIFGFLRMGLSGLVAQARGAGDVSETGALLTRGLIIGLLGGLCIIALQIPIFWAALQATPASPEVETLAKSYMGIRIWSAPAAICIFALTGWLIALERTGRVLVLQLWMNGVNILLDLVFVLGFGWGVEGVATATVIAEVSGAVIAVLMCREAFYGSQWRDWPRVLDRVKLRRMAGVSGDILLRSVVLEAAFISFLFWGAAYGDVTLAANQILIQFLHITAFALDGFAFSAEALVGQAFGARARAELRRAALLTSKWGLICVTVLALVFLATGGWIIDLMSTAPEVREVAREYLPWMVIAPLVGLVAWMMDGIFIGATRTRDLRNAMLVSGLIYLVALLSLTGTFENHGLWASIMVLFVARGVTLSLRYPALERAAA